MIRISSSPAILGRLWGGLTSLRLTLGLLIILAVVSLVGTVRPHLFTTIWFLAPLGLFSLNLSACLIRGLPQALRRCRQRLTPAGARELPERARFTWPSHRDPHPYAAALLRRELGPVSASGPGEEIVLFRERGRFRPLGPYIVHLALLFILAGALLGRFFGVDGHLTLMPGETAASFLSSEEARALPFQVRLDRFQVLHYPDGTPREFRSDLTFLKPDGSNQQAICRVNDPVTYGGFTFYQSKYGDVVRLEIKEGDSSREVAAPVGRLVELNGRGAKFRVLEYRPDLVMPMGGQEKHLGPAARLIYWQGGGHPRMIVVVQQRPELADNQPGPHRFFLTGAGTFSGLQVKRDPGVWLVYLGFLLLLPGFYLAFLRPPERWALVMSRHPQGFWDVRLKGAAPRSREAFSARLARLQELLRKGGEA